MTNVTKKTKRQRLKRITIDWLKLTVMLLDEAAILTAVLLILHYVGVRIPLSATIGLSIGLVIVVFLLHLAIIPVFHKKPVTGIESMIGMKCKVVEPLAPNGVVSIKGEYWKAESVKGEIAAGEQVEIMDSDGLLLKVGRLS
ncbi:MAG: NfeD family protein [Planctomycetota bacterium]|jgi:membrane-bound ClpP family serine protease